MWQQMQDGTKATRCVAHACAVHIARRTAAVADLVTMPVTIRFSAYFARETCVKQYVLYILAVVIYSFGSIGGATGDDDSYNPLYDTDNKQVQIQDITPQDPVSIKP